MNRDTGDTEQLGQLGQASPTTDQPVQLKPRIYSPAGYMNKALHRLVACPTKEAVGNAVSASQIVRTATIAETPGAAPVVKEAAGNIVEASLKSEQLNKVVEFEEAAQ